MHLEDWHVVRDTDKKEDHIVYGNIQEYIEECQPDLKNYTEIPFEQWDIDTLTEIIGDYYEDINLHSMCDFADNIQTMMDKADISKEQQQKFFQYYAKDLFNKH